MTRSRSIHCGPTSRRNTQKTGKSSWRTRRSSQRSTVKSARQTSKRKEWPPRLHVIGTGLVYSVISWMVHATYCVYENLLQLGCCLLRCVPFRSSHRVAPPAGMHITATAWRSERGIDWHASFVYFRKLLCIDPRQMSFNLTISVHCITLMLSGVCVFCVTAYSYGVHPFHCAKGAVIICLQSSSE